MTGVLLRRLARRSAIVFLAAGLAPVASASAVTTVGSPLTLTAEAKAKCEPHTFLNVALGAGIVASPADGLVVRWRLDLAEANGSFPYNLRVLRPGAPLTYTAAGTSPAAVPTEPGVSTFTLATPMPIQKGDVLGVDCPKGAPPPYTPGAAAGSEFSVFGNILAEGETSTLGSTLKANEELINADVVLVPSIVVVSPNAGPPAGGTTVNIAGSGLSDVTEVTFGGVPAKGLTIASDASIHVVAPPHAAGAVDVRALDLAGASATGAVDQFVYAAAPVKKLAAPVIGPISASHTTWREGSALAQIAGPHRPPVGTRFSFTLSAPANLKLAFTRSLPGRRVGHRCLAPTPGNKRRPRCLRSTPAGTLGLAAHAGNVSLAFQGQLSSTKRLPLGSYTVSFTASNAAGSSTPRRASFTIVR